MPTHKKAKLFVMIPCAYRLLSYNTYTKEVHFNGKLYAHIENQIYTRPYPRKPKVFAYWDLSIIKYFHPKILIVSCPNYIATISYQKLIQIGLEYTSRPNQINLIFNKVEDMEITDTRVYLQKKENTRPYRKRNKK